jgi:amidohydrolase
MVKVAILAATAAIALASPALAFDQAAVDRLLAGTQAQLIQWRRDVHEHPEMGNRETRTAKLVADHLRSLGLEDVRTNIAYTGVTARLRGGKPGPYVALRADMDALPVTEETTDLPFASKVKAEYRGEPVGVMHACGHDTHVANLLAVATVLSAIRQDLSGEVLFIFQPAEEGAPEGEEGGAELMLKEGIFRPRKPDAVFGLHVDSELAAGVLGYREGPFAAAVDSFYITVKGRQAHGSQPWHSIDPITTAAQIVMGLNTIVSRQVDLTAAPAVVSVGAIKGGVRTNIIPAEVSMLGTIRNYDVANRTRIFERIRRVSEGIAASQGATVDVRIEEGYPVTVNDPALTARMVPSLERAAGKDKVVRVPMGTGAEDFSYFANEVPGFYFIVGVTATGTDPKTAPTNHSPLFRVDEGALPLGLKATVYATLDFLEGR